MADDAYSSSVLYNNEKERNKAQVRAMLCAIAYTVKQQIFGP